MILVHVDPDADYLSMLSLPRDLRVEIPGHGMDKLNAAYAYGGPGLTVQTVEWLTGVDIDEYLEVDFEAFGDITDSLGGVYLDVDRRYFNEDPQCELIKLSPGYQLLDGASALDYVRFRHDLNYDFGRMDRQQRFITAMREQTLGWDLPLRLPGIVDALFDNVETTLGAGEILKLAYWGVRLDGSRIRQITLTGDPQTRDGVSYVVPPEGVMGEAIDKLMTPPVARLGAGDGRHRHRHDRRWRHRAHRRRVHRDREALHHRSGRDRKRRHVEAVRRCGAFCGGAPGYLPEGYAYVDRRPVDRGSYDIEVGDDKPGLKIVYQLTREGEETDQYLGIMETTWLDAPAAGPGQVMERNGIDYTIVGTNQKVDRIWWKVDDTLYWVSNTLSYYLSKKELLNVAESMIVIPSDGPDGRSESGDGQ